MSVEAVYIVLNKEKHNGMKYRLLQEINYYSTRYHKWIMVPVGYESDGATFAKDLACSSSFWVHDRLTNDGTFYDGSPCTAHQASAVLYDILKDEGYWFRARSWYVATLIFGSWVNKKKSGWF